MTRASDIVSRIIADLHGYGGTQDRVTNLATGISSTDTAFTVSATFGQSVGITPGIVEIGSELLYVQATDPTTNICTLTGYGRGYLNSTAVAHTAGTPVISRPVWPRKDVFNLVNEVVGSLYPDLFAVSTDSTLIFSGLTDTYQSSSSIRRVIDLSWKFPPIFPDYVTINRYRLDPFNQSIRIYDQSIPDGANLRITYTTLPDQFTAETDDVDSTGLPDSATELIRLGVLARLLPGLDVARAQRRSDDGARANIPPGSGVTTAHTAAMSFAARLQSEAKALRELYPVQIVHTY